jgi:hypothetical protein
MTNDKRKMADKIRALLAKAASTTSEAEAESFLAKAQELMEKHQLDASDLEHEDPVGYERTYERADRGGVDWDFMLLFPVARYYGCKAIRMDGWRKYEMELVGRDSARVTAIEMHKYLVKTVRRLGREKAATDPMPLYDDWDDVVGYMNADQTIRAIGNALRERINILASQQELKNKGTPTATGRNALVTLDAVVALYDKLHPDAKTIGGRMTTTDDARRIAGGISLNLQTGGRDTLRLK